MHISDRTFLTTISLLVVIAIASTAYIFLIQKDYEFVIEAPCNPDADACFYRDCEVEECPPNGFEYYRVFSVSATDFETCLDETCLTECAAGLIICAETMCGDSEEDVCAE